MTKNKLIILIVVLCTALSVHTQIFADYTGPNAGARRYSYVCGSEPCNCSMGCGGEDTGGTHYDEGSGTECQGNSPQVFCESCDVWCTANYPDAAITLTAMCSTGFGKDGWCRGDVTVTATGVDNQYKITGFENSDGTRTNVETASSSSTSAVIRETRSPLSLPSSLAGHSFLSARNTRSRMIARSLKAM